VSSVVHKAMKKGTLKNLLSQVSVPGPSGLLVLIGYLCKNCCVSTERKKCALPIFHRMYDMYNCVSKLYNIHNNNADMVTAARMFYTNGNLKITLCI